MMADTIDSKIARALHTAETYAEKAAREYAYFKNGAPYDTCEEDRVRHFLSSQDAYRRRDLSLEAAAKYQAEKDKIQDTND